MGDFLHANGVIKAAVQVTQNGIDLFRANAGVAQVIVRAGHQAIAVARQITQQFNQCRHPRQAFHAVLGLRSIRRVDCTAAGKQGAARGDVKAKQGAVIAVRESVSAMFARKAGWREMRAYGLSSRLVARF